MRNTKKITLIAAFMLYLPSAFSQTAVNLSNQEGTLPLDSILLQINQQNRNLDAYTNRARSLNAKSEGAKAQMAPKIGGGTYMVPYPGQTVTDPGDKGAWMFSLEQDITNPVKLRRKQDYERSLGAIETEGRNVAYNDLRAEAKKLYYQWMVDLKKLKLLKENEQILTSLHKLAQIRYPYNKATLSSVYSAEGKLAEVQNQQLVLNANIRKKMYQLNTLMNRPATTSFNIDTAAEPVFKPLAVVDTAYLGQSRSSIRQIDRNISSMSLNIKAMKAEAKPDFSFRLDNMFNRDPMMPIQYTGSVMVSIPIAPWSSKSYKSGVKSMKYNVEAMKSEREAMLVEAQNMVSTLFNDVTTMRSQLNNYEHKILPALKKSFEANNIAYEENRLDLPQVINSWETLNMNRMSYLDGLQEYYLMIADYEKEIEKK